MQVPYDDLQDAASIDFAPSCRKDQEWADHSTTSATTVPHTLPMLPDTHSLNSVLSTNPQRCAQQPLSLAPPESTPQLLQAEALVMHSMPTGMPMWLSHPQHQLPFVPQFHHFHHHQYTVAHQGTAQQVLVLSNQGGPTGMSFSMVPPQYLQAPQGAWVTFAPPHPIAPPPTYAHAHNSAAAGHASPPAYGSQTMSAAAANEMQRPRVHGAVLAGVCEWVPFTPRPRGAVDLSTSARFDSGFKVFVGQTRHETTVGNIMELFEHAARIAPLMVRPAGKGCFITFVDSADACHRLTQLHRRVLMDHGGAWHAATPAAAERLAEYVASTQFRHVADAKLPKQPLVVEYQPSAGAGSTSDGHRRTH
jgi:hypothetical protein